MKTKTSELQESLLGFIKSTKVGNVFLKIAFVFIIARVGEQISGLFFIGGSYEFIEVQMYNIIARTIYYGYFIGLILCFAKNDMIWLIVSFGSSALCAFINIIITIINYVNVDYALPISPAWFDLAVYVFLLILCIRKFIRENPNKNNYAPYNMQNNNYMNGAGMNSNMQNAPQFAQQNAPQFEQSTPQFAQQNAPQFEQSAPQFAQQNAPQFEQNAPQFEQSAPQFAQNDQDMYNVDNMATQSIYDFDLNQNNAAPISEQGTNARVCPNCGKALNHGEVFCTNCGTKI